MANRAQPGWAAGSSPGRLRPGFHGGSAISLLGVRDGSAGPDQRWAGRGWLPFASWLTGEGTVARRAWRGAYVRRIVIADAVCAALAGLTGYLVRFGPESGGVVSSSLWAAVLLAALGTASWAFQLDVARGFVVLAVPLAAWLTLLQRFTQRKVLHRARRRGQHLQTTLLVGHRSAVASLDEQLDREAFHGYRVVGCCLPADQFSPTVDAFNGLPILGHLAEVADVVARYEVDTVAVLPCPELDGPALRRLGWALEKTPAELLLAPAVTEIVGTRVRIRPVCGLPLMHMERPELTGIRRVAKELFDRSAALLGVVLLAPVLLGIALAVKATSRGPSGTRRPRGADVLDAEIPQHGHGRPPDDRRSGPRERRQRRPLQEEGRSPRHARGQVPPALLAGRAASAVQRAPRRHVPRRPAPAPSPGGRPLRLRHAPPVPGEAWSDRPVAGQRPLGSLVGRLRAHRRPVRRELVAHLRLHDPLEDSGRRAA